MIVQVDPMACASGLGTKLAFMRKCDEFCDFTIVVSGLEVKAHRCVLAATCDYFKTSFSFNDLSQSLTQADFTHVGSNVEAVEKVIQSLYTNEIDLEPSSLEGILLLADYLMHDSLHRCIETFMNTTLTFSTAVLYFQLALQYRLHSSELINDIKWLLYFRFHDYFIYQQETLEANMDLLTAFMTYGIFQHCSPLQITEFMLNNVRIALEKLHTFALETKTDLSSEMGVRLESTFTKLSALFMKARPEILEKWKPHLVDFLRTWRKSHLSADSDNVSELFWYVQALELQVSDHIDEIDCVCLKTGTYHTCWGKLLKVNFFKKTVILEADSFVVIVCSNPKCALQDRFSIPTPYIDTTQPSTAHPDFLKGTELRWRLCTCAPETLKDWLVNAQKSGPESQIIPAAEPKLVDTNNSQMDQNKSDKSMTVSGSSQTVRELDPSARESDDTPGKKAELSQDVPRVMLPAHSVTSQKNECNILVLLAPTGDMTAQLLATDEETDRRLVRSPKLELCYYDIEMRRWCRGCKLDLPIPGAMLERHSWRIAYLKSCLYMFSLGHGVGLQFNTVKNSWVYLECQNIFSAHGTSSPVKSVIPIKVGRKLIVLSMSRESQLDGTFLTQQHFFEMQDDCRTFSKVASIQGDQVDMPVTQWTVCDQTLVTVKSSTMMNRSLSHIQHIHLYNAETRVLLTHEAVCTMDAGVKILVRDQVIYILNRDGWCRIYDFQKSAWAEMKRYVSMAKSTVWQQNSETTYPALTHMACHAGSSRWEVISGQDRIHTGMVEMVVTDDGNLETVPHPSPPFQFMTALSPSTMSRSQLDAMEQPIFTQIDNLRLDFSHCDQTRT